LIHFYKRRFSQKFSLTLGARLLDQSCAETTSPGSSTSARVTMTSTGRSVGLTVTPWSSWEEWRVVRELVIAKDKEALKYINVWAARVSRLPAGVEATLSLLTANTASSQTPLLLGTAVNRFLNHVSHLAMNLWGLTKLHEAGARLSVPEWLVELRHETTHGQMPCLTILQAAVEFGLSWLTVHYWTDNKEEAVDDSSQEDELHKLLECYMYLKLYHIWGTVRMAELQSQCEVWDHLKDLWQVVKGGHQLAELSVKQAVGLVKTEVCNMCEGEDGIEHLASILVENDLLVPEKDFLESLEEDKGIGNEVNVPTQLVMIWSDFIQLIDKVVGAKVILNRLLEKVKLGRSGSEIAAAWCVLLAEGMAGVRTNKLMPIAQDQVDNNILQKWLDRPNKLISQLCGLLCIVAGLGMEDQKRDKIVKLVRVAVGSTCEGKKDEEPIYTENDLITCEGLAEDKKDKSNTKWTLDIEHNWESVRLGGWMNQSWDELWVGGEWSDSNCSSKSCEPLPKFDIGPIDWNQARGIKHKTDNEIPHFYSNRHHLKNHNLKRQKR